MAVDFLLGLLEGDPGRRYAGLAFQSRLRLTKGGADFGSAAKLRSSCLFPAAPHAMGRVFQFGWIIRLANRMIEWRP